MTDPSSFLSEFTTYIQTQDSAVFMLIATTLLALLGWFMISKVIDLPEILIRPLRLAYPYAVLAVYLIFTIYLWSTL